MGLQNTPRDIPRVWEVDWAIPPEEGGTPWDAYAWLLDTARHLGATDASIVGATYDQLGQLDLAISPAVAGHLRVKPHSFTVDGITVHGVSCRGSWRVRGPVLVAWANEDVLTEIEGRKPSAIAAVATWPDYIAGWRSLYHPTRIGQVRVDQEADWDTATASELDPSVEEAIRGAAALVNEHHSVLSTHERERMAGVFVALRVSGIRVDTDALRTHLMAAGWNGKLVSGVLQLANRVAGGETPRHQHVELSVES